MDVDDFIFRNEPAGSGDNKQFKTELRLLLDNYVKKSDLRKLVEERRNSIASTDLGPPADMEATSTWAARIEKLLNKGVMKVSEWISVDDRLPDNRTMVIAYCIPLYRDDYVTVCWYENGEFYDQGKTVRVEQWQLMPGIPTI
jgi:hypothetical protein